MDSLSCTTVENDALHFSFLTFKNSSQQLCHRNSDTQFGNNCDHFKSYKFFKSNNIYMLHEHNIRGHLIGISHIVLPSRHGAASWSLTSRIFVVVLRRIGGLASRKPIPSKQIQGGFPTKHSVSVEVFPLRKLAVCVSK